MIGYLDELYRIYLELDEEEDITLDFEPQPKTVKSEFGEVCLSPIGLFLVTATSGRYVTGFKVSPWIDFAINTDFIFSFDNKKWVAITEHELWIPEDQLSHIGMIDSVDLEIFYNYYANKKPIPSSHSGLTIPDDPGYPQNKFREREMAKCLEFIMSQFQALEELEESDVIEENTAIESKKVIDILTFKKIFSEKIITAELPMAAASSSKVAQGENFYLFYENGLLTIIMNSDGESAGLIKIEFESEEYITIPENNRIEIEIIKDHLPLEYLAQKIRISRVRSIE